MGNEQGKVLDTTTPEGVQTMDENLQRKFSKGIQYNMKVVVRGDRNTGKSCLLYRMQGKTFSESYIPTNEIQVGHILWTYPGTSDTVKVEIWDTVDKGKSQKSSRGLKLFNKAEDGAAEPVLDAEFLDVYKGAHAVILMYDIVKQWTWQYIERQIVHVPYHVPILVLGNFSDMGEHRNIPYEDADFYVTHLNRPEGAADVRYAECSMKNGFGLRFLHKFLSIPFLQMQQESLLHQLKTNREQILVIQEELDGYQSSTSYEQFQNSSATPQKPEKAVAEATPSTPPTKPKPSPVVDTSKAFDSSVGSTPDNEVPTGKKLSSKLSGFLSKTKEPSNVQQKGKPQTNSKSLTPKSPAGKKGVKNVEEFVPDGDLDDQFFNDDDSTKGEEENEENDTNSDEDYNPQVAMDQDLSSVEGEEEEEEEEEGEGPEEGVVAGVATLSLTQQQDDDIEEDEDDVDDDSPVEEVDGDHRFIEEESPDILIPSVVKPTPVSPPKPKKKTEIKPLKSVHDIVLTESEEEKSDDEPIATQDVFVPKPSKEKSSKKGSGGLLLAFNETQPVKQKPKKKKSEVEVSESPSTERKKERRSSGSKHKKHKKKSSRREKEQEAVVEVKPKADEDPFEFTTSLDAWLGAGDESPAQPRSTHGLSRRLTESIEEEEEEKPTKKRDGKKRRKSKKDSAVLNELI